MTIFCVKSLEAIRVSKADQLFGAYFYRIIFSGLDFFFAFAFAPLSFSIPLLLTNLAFLAGYGAVYFDELKSDEKELSSDTGSSIGP